ncbi:MAG: cysteine desulfurase [Candidatus Yanofskybacteria bacterium]|nr:cysteine desulfurase [Candidatus Yanofskybacteria bacterium]
MAKHIYLDNAAATPIDPAVVREVVAASKTVGNPSAFNAAGRDAAAVVHRARQVVATFLHAHPSEIVFCASGSEANTLALLGSFPAGETGGVVTTPIEHRSVLEAVRKLRAAGADVATVQVGPDGVVRAEDVVAAITPHTRIVSVMYANNEVGALQPVARIGAMIARWRRERKSRFPIFHVDACQAAGYERMDVQRLGVDLLTFNGTKIYGPRGCAVLFVRRGITVEPRVLGGVQEGGRRAGTEDVANIAGLAAAVQRVSAVPAARIARLRDRLAEGILKAVPDARIHGPAEGARLPNIVSVSIPGAHSERLLLELDRFGISAGSGSACTAHSVESSHVLRAMGVPKRFLEGVLRFSLSKYTTRQDIDRVIQAFPEVVARARRTRG